MGVRWRRFAGEVSKYLAVGGVATIVSVFLFNLMVHGFTRSWEPPLNGHPLLGFVIANLIGMWISYQGTKSWAFRDREPVHADGGVTAYLAINLVTMLIPMICLKISRDLIGLTDPFSDNISANVIGLFLGLVARFWLYRTYVFRRPESPAVTLFQPLLRHANQQDVRDEARATSEGMDEPPEQRQES